MLLTAALVVWGNGNPSRASLLRAMDVIELARTADRIVIGKVVGVNAAWDLQHRRILSTIDVDIEESWKGAAEGSARITIVQPGGRVGELEMTVQGMPSFVAGERSLLFLQGRRHFQVAGMGQGKRALAWHEASQEWLVESPTTEDVVEVGPDARLRQAKHQAPIPLRELRERIRQALGNSP